MAVLVALGCAILRVLVRIHVQWVFITNLKLMENSLFVRDEKARCYSVNLKTHRVHEASCGTVFVQQERAGQ